MDAGAYAMRIMLEVMKHIFTHCNVAITPTHISLHFTYTLPVKLARKELTARDRQSINFNKDSWNA
jgi:hypothetical protein